MSDRALESKFTDLADGILTPSRTGRLIDLCWNVQTLEDAADIVRAGVPELPHAAAGPRARAAQ